MVPVRSELDEEYRLEYLEGDIPLTPEVSLLEARKEIAKFGRLTHEMLHMVRELLTAKDQREFDAIVDGLVASVEKHAAGRTTNNRTGTTAGDRAVRLFKGFFASHRKMASLARQMDGSQDGGAMWESFIRSMNEAGDRETTMREQATVKLVELVKMLKGGERMQKKLPLRKRRSWAGRRWSRVFLKEEKFTFLRSPANRYF